MLSRKTSPAPHQPFSRILPSCWILEYRGQLPHCKRQGVAVIHWLQCNRFDPASLPVEEKISIGSSFMPTHEVWCVCTIPKDRGIKRLLFHQYLHLSVVIGQARQDWVTYKVGMHLAAKLNAAVDLHHLIRCDWLKEYPWCAVGGDLDDYWEAETKSKARSLVLLLGR